MENYIASVENLIANINNNSHELIYADFIKRIEICKKERTMTETIMPRIRHRNNDDDDDDCDDVSKKS